MKYICTDFIMTEVIKKKLTKKNPKNNNVFSTPSFDNFELFVYLEKLNVLLFFLNLKELYMLSDIFIHVSVYLLVRKLLCNNFTKRKISSTD